MALTLDSLRAFFDQIYSHGPVTVSTGHSALGQPTQRFASAAELWDHLHRQHSLGIKFQDYAIYYLDSAGYVKDRRLKLDPAHGQGHTFRYSVDGWGLIHLQLALETERVECRLSVNSEKRAQKWFGTYPELKDPQLWRWAAVRRHQRHLQTQLKKLPPAP